MIIQHSEILANISKQPLSEHNAQCEAILALIGAPLCFCYPPFCLNELINQVLSHVRTQKREKSVANITMILIVDSTTFESNAYAY